MPSTVICPFICPSMLLFICPTRIYLAVDFSFFFALYLTCSSVGPVSVTVHLSSSLSTCDAAIYPSVRPSIAIPPSIPPSLTRGVDGGVHYYRASQNRVSFYYKSLWSPWLPKLQARLLTHKKGCAAENQPPQ